MDDLGLTLSLNFPAAVDEPLFCNSYSLQYNLMRPLVSSSSPFSWTKSFTSSDRYNSTAYKVEVDTKPLLKGMDVNRMPRIAAEAEEEAGVSSPNSTVSSISGKKSAREDHDVERASSRGMSDEEDGGDDCRKKLRLSKDQSAVLEESFKEHSTLNPKQKQALAKKLGLRPRQVEVWFQNRRARTKLKQTEVECELMKRCCENLTEENRRLQKELQELRAFKLSPQFYMQKSATSPTTLTMCPSCEHVASSSTTPHHSKLPFNPWPYHGP